MKKMLVLLCLVLIFSGCVSETVRIEQSLKKEQALAMKNNELIKKLQLGMTRKEVTKLLGSPDSKMNTRDKINNEPVVVYFYLTESRKTGISRTPVVFKNNKLVGWGLDYFDKCCIRKWEFVL